MRDSMLKNVIKNSLILKNATEFSVIHCIADTIRFYAFSKIHKFTSSLRRTVIGIVSCTHDRYFVHVFLHYFPLFALFIHY